MVSKVRNFESNNVLAMLPGSDRKLKDEAVIYTAHYDHFGIRPDMPGDNILMAQTTMLRAAAFCWSWHIPMAALRCGRGAQSFSRR